MPSSHNLRRSLALHTPNKASVPPPNQHGNIFGDSKSSTHRRDTARPVHSKRGEFVQICLEVGTHSTVLCHHQGNQPVTPQADIQQRVLVPVELVPFLLGGGITDAAS